MNFKILLIAMNCLLMAVSRVAGSILMRLYYLHGGKMKWLTSSLLTAGFPILIIPIAVSYAKKRAKAGAETPAGALLVTRWLALSSVVVGCLIGVCSYLYNFGASYLPVSVSSLLVSSQLAFTAVFAYLIVKHKFTHYSFNAVILMTMGSLILGLHMDGDRPAGESDSKYSLGFFLTLVGAALQGLIMPAVEYIHLNSGVPVTYDLVMQVQFLVSMFATMFCTVAMIINKDFQNIPREARQFDLGETKYYALLGTAAVILQLGMIGSLGLVFCATSLLGGIVTSLLVPVQQVFAIMFLPEKFNAEKCMSLAMCLWGFTSYFYGEYKQSKKKRLANVAKINEEDEDDVVV